MRTGYSHLDRSKDKEFYSILNSFFPVLMSIIFSSFFFFPLGIRLSIVLKMISVFWDHLIWVAWWVDFLGNSEVQSTNGIALTAIRMGSAWNFPHCLSCSHSWDSSLQTLIWLLQNSELSKDKGSFHSPIQIPENLDLQPVQSFRKTKVYHIEKHYLAPTGMASATNWGVFLKADSVTHSWHSGVSPSDITVRS